MTNVILLALERKTGFELALTREYSRELCLLGRGFE